MVELFLVMRLEGCAGFQNRKTVKGIERVLNIILRAVQRQNNVLH